MLNIYAICGKQGCRDFMKTSSMDTLPSWKRLSIMGIKSQHKITNHDEHSKSRVSFLWNLTDIFTSLANPHMRQHFCIPDHTWQLAICNLGKAAKNCITRRMQLCCCKLCYFRGALYMCMTYVMQCISGCVVFAHQLSHAWYLFRPRVPKQFVTCESAFLYFEYIFSSFCLPLSTFTDQISYYLVLL